MAEPRSWLLLADVEACLARIQKANGFWTDAGLNITREPHQQPNAAGTLIEIAIAGIGKATDPALVRTHRLVTVAVAAMVSVTADDPQFVLHCIHDDVERAMTDQHAQFGDGRSTPKFESSAPIKPADGMAWSGVDIRYTTHVRIR